MANNAVMEIIGRGYEILGDVPTCPVHLFSTNGVFWAGTDQSKTERIHVPQNRPGRNSAQSRLKFWRRTMTRHTVSSARRPILQWVTTSPTTFE
jgi:hypothetical protein